MTYPRSSIAKTGRAGCIHCGAKITAGELKLEVERENTAPTGPRKVAASLHVDCATAWVTQVGWPGGMPQLASELATNGEVPVPAFARLAAAPLPPGDPAALTAAVQSKDPAAVRALIAGHRWPVDVVEARMNKPLYKAFDDASWIPVCTELLAAPGVAAQVYLDVTSHNAIVLAPALAAAARALLTPPLAAEKFIERMLIQRGAGLIDAVVRQLVDGIDPTHVHEGLCAIHAAAIGGIPTAVTHLQAHVNLPLPADVRLYPGMTSGRDTSGSVPMRLLALAAGSLPLDIAEASLRLVDAGLMGWARAPASDSVTQGYRAALTDWKARLEAVIAQLVELGARRSPPPPDPAPIAALRAQLLAVAASADAGADVAAAIGALRPEGVGIARFLVDGLRALNGRAAPLARQQTDPFWQAALGGPIDAMVGYPSSDEEFSGIHVYDSTTESAFDWDSRTRAIDVGRLSAAVRKALVDGQPVALGREHVWMITGLDTPKEQLVRIDLESHTLTKLGKLDAFCQTTLIAYS